MKSKKNGKQPTYYTANQLRALAEELDSFRNTEVVIVATGEKESPFLVIPEADAGAVPNVLLRCRTSDDETAKPKPLVLKVDKANLSADGSVLETLEDFDAIFTSLSAVEKFVVPYYASMSTLAECEERRREFSKNPSAVAVLHTPKSVSKVATVGRGPFFSVIREGRNKLRLEEF